MTEPTVRDGIYLEDNPPARDQYRTGRRDPVKPVIVVHTAESGTDMFGPDPKAENVANFIRNRNSAGSYHLIGDTDSIIQLVRFEDEAFHDATGSNRWSIGISLAMNAADWPTLSQDRSGQLLDTAAAMAVIAADWLQRHGHPAPTARLLTRPESNHPDASGFISHHRRDPTRRSDPGDGFPWPAFFRRYTAALNDPGLSTKIKILQRVVGVDDDGIAGPVTIKATLDHIHNLDDRLTRIVQIGQGQE